MGQIVCTDKGILAVEQNKVLIPPAWNKTFAWGYADLSCRLGTYESDKVCIASLLQPSACLDSLAGTVTVPKEQVFLGILPRDPSQQRAYHFCNLNILLLSGHSLATHHVNSTAPSYSTKAVLCPRETDRWSVRCGPLLAPPTQVDYIAPWSHQALFSLGRMFLKHACSQHTCYHHTG